MAQIIKINVPVSNEYDVYIGSGMRFSTHLLDFCRGIGSRFLILTDDNVYSLYGDALLSLMKKEGLDVKMMSLGEGEHSKTRECKEYLENEMLSQGFGRDTAVIALGGGVVSDLGGFLASTYCRGVPVIYLPTTFLAMVDASIGGKTGVNTTFGKNMIGSFSHPKAVFIDVDTLETLSDEEYFGGFIEVIKHMLLKGGEGYKNVSQSAKALHGRDLSFLTTLIAENCAFKRDIVVEDELESGVRATLNLGHTVGHAIELISEHNIGHGAAVALGIIAEAKMAEYAGIMKGQCFLEIETLLSATLKELSFDVSGVTYLQLRDALVLDKKSRALKPRFALLKSIGVPFIYDVNFTVELEEKFIKSGILYLLEGFKNPC